MIEWIEVTKGLPEEGKKVIVKTKTNYSAGNVLNISFKYNEKGNPVWACNNQTVTHYLKEN